MCNWLQRWCPSFLENKNFHFSPYYGSKKPKNWSFFVIFGFGASDLKDGRTEFNETFTHCVMCYQDDAHHFGMWKFLFLKPNHGQKTLKNGSFLMTWMWSVRSQRWLNRFQWNFHTLRNMLPAWCTFFQNVKIPIFYHITPKKLKIGHISSTGP